MKMMQEIMDQSSVLENLHEYLDSKKEVLRHLINRCNTIYLFGTGASLNACYASELPFVYHLKKKPIIIPAGEANYYLGLIADDDLVIVVSQSGDSFETKDICRRLNEKAIDFIGITNNSGSTLAKKATTVLNMLADDEVSSATKTYTAPIFILYYLSMINHDTDCLIDVYNKVKIYHRQENLYQPFVDEIARHDKMYVLSDFLNYSTARASALLLKEKDLILAEPMTLSEFRHGAVEVIKEGFLCFVIISEKNYLSEFYKHLEYLLSIKADVLCISAFELDGFDKNRVIKVPELLNETFSPLLMTIPSQIISALVAQKLGLDVDGFIHLNKVVSDY
jgi:glucosamine--fructose-6-phosphate aminotransferase (isomerizing)